MTFGGTSNDVPARNAPPTVVVSYRIWRDMFGSDPAVVGKPSASPKSARPSRASRRVISTRRTAADFWFTVPIDPQQVAHVFEVYMRVKPGTTLARVRSEMAR